MKNFNNYNYIRGGFKMNKKVMLILMVLVAVPSMLLASGSGMPWEGPMDKILNSITGPWLRFGTIVAIIVCSLAVAFGEMQGFFKKAIYVVMGLSIACAAVGWGLTFFGFSGGLLF